MTMNCADCGHPEPRHTAAGNACYFDGCHCARFVPSPDPGHDAREAVLAIAIALDVGVVVPVAEVRVALELDLAVGVLHLDALGVAVLVVGFALDRHAVGVGVVLGEAAGTIVWSLVAVAVAVA